METKENKQHVQLPNNMTKEVTPKDLVIYLAIRRYANKETKEAFPSLDTLHKVTGAAINTIRNCISNLVEANKISIRKEGRKNVYKFATFNDGFEPFSYEFLDKKDLTFTEKAYLIASQQYMFKKDGEGKVEFTNKELSSKINMPQQTISKCNHSLMNKGYLSINKEKDPITELVTTTKAFHLNKLGQAIVFILKNHEDRLNTQEKQIEKNTEDISIIKELISENPELFKKFLEKKKEKELVMN